MTIRLHLCLLLLVWGLGWENARAQASAGYCVDNLGGSQCLLYSVNVANTTLSASLSPCDQFNLPLASNAGLSTGSNYILNPPTPPYSAQFTPGTTYQLTTSFLAGCRLMLWLDANRDSTFSTSEYQLLTAASSAQTQTFAFTVPGSARPGRTRLRLRTVRLTPSPPTIIYGAADACTQFNFDGGETRDFEVVLGPSPSPVVAPYCAANLQTPQAGFTQITEFMLVGTTLRNNTGNAPTRPASLYPAMGNTTARVELGRTYPLYVQTYGLATYLALWADWNQNQQFEPAEFQLISTSLTGGTYTYSGQLVVPPTAALGTTRLRLRIRSNAALTAADACTTMANGETEDYTLTVAAPSAGPSLPAFNPAPRWAAARVDGAASSDDGTLALAVDSASGATYAAGWFQNTFRFGPYTATSGAGRDAAFVGKYDAAGTPLWVRSTDLNGPGTSSTARSVDMAVDRQGNLYVIGMLSGTARFGPGISVTTSASGGSFLAKYAPDGTALWARSVLRASSIGGSDTALHGLAVDAQGNVCVVGNVYVSSERATDLYYAKYDPQGNQLWLRLVPGINYDYGYDVTALPGGDFVLAATYSFPFRLDGQLVNSGGGMMLLRVSPLGTLVWASTVVGAIPTRIAYDRRSGGLLVAGQTGPALFQGPGGPSFDADGGFVAHYRLNGSLRWASPAVGYLRALEPDGTGGLYLGGTIGAGRMGGIVLPASSTAPQPFVAHYDSVGTARWVATATTSSPSGYTAVWGLGRLADGTLLAAGSFIGPMRLNNITLANNGAGSYNDAFLARLNPACTVPALSTVGGCIGDTLRLRAQGAPAGSMLQWRGPNGFASAQALPILPGVTAAATGTYTLTATAPRGCTSTDSLVVRIGAPPAQPVVQVAYNGPLTTLRSGSTTGNQWYLNGQPIAGATGATYVVTNAAQFGAYTLVVTSATGCASSASAPLLVTATASTRAAALLVLHPNPTPDGRLWLTGTATARAADLTVRNAVGQVVYAQRLPASDGAPIALDCRGLPAGIYLLQVRQGQEMHTSKFVRE